MESKNYEEVYCHCNNVIFLPFWIDEGIWVIPLSTKQGYIMSFYLGGCTGKKRRNYVR